MIFWNISTGYQPASVPCSRFPLIQRSRENRAATSMRIFREIEIPLIKAPSSSPRHRLVYTAITTLTSSCFCRPRECGRDLQHHESHQRRFLWKSCRAHRVLSHHSFSALGLAKLLMGKQVQLSKSNVASERVGRKEHPHVAIRNVTKTFGNQGSRQCLSRNRPGKLYQLLGPSGCGKTTLLRSIAGFYQIDEGEISIDAASSTAFHPTCATRSWCSRTTRSSPHDHKGKHHLRAAHRKMPREEISAGSKRGPLPRYRDAARQNAGTDHGGQQQRVGPCARPLMEPEVLLLDEPLSNLDANLRNAIRAELRQLQQRLRITTIYVTHDQAEALAMSDSIAVLNAGKIIQIGFPCRDLLSSRQQVRRFLRRHRQLLEGSITDIDVAAYSRRGERSSDILIERRKFDAEPSGISNSRRRSSSSSDLRA